MKQKYPIYVFREANLLYTYAYYYGDIPLHIFMKPPQKNPYEQSKAISA